MKDRHRLQGSASARSTPTASPARTSGDISAVAPPVPIPNTEVKHCSPDGSTATGRARVGRRQNPATWRQVAGLFFSGSARASRAGERALAFTNFSPCFSLQRLSLNPQLSAASVSRASPHAPVTPDAANSGPGHKATDSEATKHRSEIPLANDAVPSCLRST